MNNRMMNPSPLERRAFGLVAWLEQTRVVLPLKGVECSFDVCGDVVSVEIDQIFLQSNPQPLDCLYTFPLPAGAAVYRCEMRVNGRLVRARVEEREAARKLAAEKKAAGYRTALVEMERDNLFTLSLGNVQSGDLVVIRFAYFQTLTRLGDWTSFSIPFCPGIRYIPGAPLLRPPSGRTPPASLRRGLTSYIRTPLIFRCKEKSSIRSAR
jgi:Ca-activated chloride channel homolog